MRAVVLGAGVGLYRFVSMGVAGDAVLLSPPYYCVLPRLKDCLVFPDLAHRREAADTSSNIRKRPGEMGPRRVWGGPVSPPPMLIREGLHLVPMRAKAERMMQPCG